MGDELELPEELYGFGSLLLWVLATRATRIVDLCYAAGPARPSPEYGVVDGHPVPTASLVAWLLTAAELGLPVDGLAQRDPSADQRQHVLRTIMSRVLQGRSELFENRWLDRLTVICRLGAAEHELLATSRDEAGHPVEPKALRQAIARTLRSRPPTGSSVSDTADSVRTLPRDIASFTGREAELQQLAVAVAAVPAGGVVGIHAIGGMAGVGKTAFAVHAAHRLAPRFPDGQIFLPLHGYAPQQPPVTPEDALARLLQISGISAEHIPPSLEARAALWRGYLASRRVLLLLDDAAGHEQVRPLLPGTAGSLVLITSRRRLTALEDTQSISLDTLTPDEAVRLFVQLAGRPAVKPDDSDVAQITQLCGGLPLAIGMQARRLHHHPAWSTADLAADLAGAHDRLALMQAENLSVAIAFDLSYGHLAEDSKYMFRSLGLHPGDDIDAHAVAALTDTDPAAARRHLEDLYDHYLLTEPGPGRYRLHDLLREHARALAAADPPADQERRLERLLDYYQHAATVAEDLLARHPRVPATSQAGSWSPAVVPALPDRQRALAWVRTEGSNLLACLDQVTSGRQDARVISLTAALAALLHDGPWIDALSRHATALQAARRIGDRLAEASAMYEMGLIQQLTGDYTQAVQTQQAALVVYQDESNQLGEANVRHEVGTIQRLTGNYPQAMQTQQVALGIYRDLGNRFGEANVRHELGALGYMSGDYQAAVEAQQAALNIYRDIGDELGQANVLLYLGAIRYLTGDDQAAAEVLEEALGMYRKLGHQRGQANAFLQLGVARQRSGDYDGAVKALQSALQICQNLGYRGGEANALHYLGATLRLSGDYEGAAEALETALGIYRDIGDPGGEAEALNEAGTLYRLHGRPHDAEASHLKALNLARTIDSAWDEAHALAGLGRCALLAEHVTEAREYLMQAQKIFAKDSPDEAASITAELDALSTMEQAP